MGYLISRLKERSTWVGLVGITTSLGMGLCPLDIETIATIGTAVASAISTLVPDPK